MNLDVANATPKTWSSYCQDIGLDRSTAHRWLEHYEPQEQRLLTDDEYQLKQEEKRRAEMSIRDANNSRVNQAIKTGAIPRGWNDECQKLYDEKIKENRLRDERIKKMQDDMKRESEQRNEKANERYSRKEEIDELIKNITTSVSKRAEFKERIRISHEGQNDQFIDALMDYLNELADDSRRIEACYNIIKVCKGIANDLQVKA